MVRRRRQAPRVRAAAPGLAHPGPKEQPRRGREEAQAGEGQAPGARLGFGGFIPWWNPAIRFGERMWI